LDTPQIGSYPLKRRVLENIKRWLNHIETSPWTSKEYVKFEDETTIQYLYLYLSHPSAFCKRGSCNTYIEFEEDERKIDLIINIVNSFKEYVPPNIKKNHVGRNDYGREKPLGNITYNVTQTRDILRKSGLWENASKLYSAFTTPTEKVQCIEKKNRFSGLEID